MCGSTSSGANDREDLRMDSRMQGILGHNLDKSRCLILMGYNLRDFNRLIDFSGFPGLIAAVGSLFADDYRKGFHFQTMGIHSG